MSGIQRILVQLSPEDDNASLMARTGRLAQLSGASVELFCSVYSRELHRDYLFDKKAELHAEHGYVKGVEAKLEALSAPLEAQQIKVGLDVYWERHLVEGVMRKIQRFEPDLVIASMTHHNIVTELFSPDAERTLIRECPAPLLLARKQGWPDQVGLAASIDPFHPCPEPVALDNAVLDMAQQMALILGSQMRVVHSFHALPHSAIFDEHVVTDYEALQSKVLQEHRDRIDTVLEPYGLGIGSPEVSILEGEAHKVLPDYAQRVPVSLLVVGHVAKGMLERILSGSTVERMLGSLPCDLLVVKPPGFVCPTDYEE